MPTMHIHTPPLFQVELEKTTENRWTYFGVKVPRTLDYPSSSHKLKSALEYTVQSQCTPVPDRQTDGPTDRRTDRKTDEHRGNSATIRSNEHIAR